MVPDLLTFCHRTICLKLRTGLYQYLNVIPARKFLRMRANPWTTVFHTKRVEK